MARCGWTLRAVSDASRPGWDPKRDPNVVPGPGFGRGGGGVVDGGNPPQNPDMDIRERLAKIEGTLIAAPVVVAVLGTLATFTLGMMVYSFTSTTNQINQVSARIDKLEAKVDAIPARLDEQFRAMRAEMSAQTSAIANSITATKQAAPQILLVPAPVIQAPPPDK